MGQTDRLAAPAGPPPVAPAVQRAALLMVGVSAFAQPLMLSSVTVALPAMAADLALSAVSLSWIPLMFLLSSAATVLAFGRLADMYGRKRIFVWGSWGLVGSSLLLASAPNGAALIALRALQGVSAAMLYATQAAIIVSICPPARRGRALGMIASVLYLGLTAGPLLGGWLVEHFGWRVAFVVNLPLTLCVLLLLVPRVKGEWAAAQRGHFDGLGAAIYALGILCVITGATALQGRSGALMAGVGGLLLWQFVRRQKGRADPLFDVSLFLSNRVFALSSLAALLMYTTTFSILVLISLHLQYLKGLQPSQAGLVMFAQPLVTALMSPLVGRLSDRVEPRLLATAGVVVTALGLVALGGIGRDTSLARITVCLAFTGLGFSLFASTNVNAIMSSIATGQQGSASGAVATMRVLGQLCSMGLVAMAFSLTLGVAQITPETYLQLERALSLSFRLAALLCVPCVFFSLARGRLRPR
ncbi:MAG: MFS transporter [Gammaproteobacteria bacterium]|nr:MFS transporter [Gammaproteobacteria bacterium]